MLIGKAPENQKNAVSSPVVLSMITDAHARNDGQPLRKNLPFKEYIEEYAILISDQLASIYL